MTNPPNQPLGLPERPLAPGRSSKPLVSVIVPTFNRASFIERCVQSILNQSYRNLECIVMDGASKDESTTVLQRLSEADPRLRFVSEPDNGEVFATNKGLDLAKGEIFGILASDDCYVPDAIESAVAFLLKYPEYAGVSGDAIYVDDQGQSLNRGVVTYRGEMSANTVRRILMVRYKSCFVCVGSFFGWRDRILRHGKLDPNSSVTADWEFYSRLLAAGERLGSLPRVLYHFTIHSDMGALKHAKKADLQHALLRKKYGFKWYHELFWSTIGRAISYFSNPYRSALLPGMRQEIERLLPRK